MPPIVAVLLLAWCAIAVAQPVFLDGFETVEEEPAEYDCHVDGVMPSQWNLLMSSWSSTFSSPDGDPRATYPNGVSFPTPVGARRGQMRVVTFVPNPAQTVNMYWDEAQSRPSDGYQPSRPSSGMWFAISPCIGDMRPPDYFGEPFLRSGCREFGSSAALIWTTSASVAESDAILCKLEAGRTYYMTISPTNVLDGLQTGEHTCITDDLRGCDVGVILGVGSGD